MEHEIIGARDGRAWLQMKCGRKAEDGTVVNCQVPLRQGDPRAPTWGWDGKEQGATVSPSVSCNVCGFHKTLVKGAWQ